MPEVRKWHVDQAVFSTRTCAEIAMELTLPELEAAIALEAATKRRKNILRRLIGRAVQKNGEQYLSYLNSL